MSVEHEYSALRKGKFEVQPDGSLGHSPVPNAGLFSKITSRRDNVLHSLPDDDGKRSRSRTFIKYVSPYADEIPEHLDIKNNITHVDYLRTTAVGDDVLHCVQEVQDLLKYPQYVADPVADTDIEFKDTQKGYLGYPHCVKIVVVTDHSGLVDLGHIAWQDDKTSKMCGVMFDLTGKFFDYLREYAPWKYRDLFDYFTGYRFRITRADLALDLMGSYCRAKNITVPVLNREACDNDLLKSQFNHHSTGNKKLKAFDAADTKSANNGDWNCIINGHVSVDNYNPEKYSPSGLTAYHGSRKNPSFFRLYEKDKQVIGLADLGEDHDLDKWKVRIEHEIKPNKDTAPLPFEILLAPDLFFAAGRPKLRDLYSAYRAHLELHELFAIQMLRFKQNAQLSLKKKIFWAKRSYGRSVRTLREQGLSADEIVDALIREEGLKDFVYDLHDITITGIADIDFVENTSLHPSAIAADSLRGSYGLVYPVRDFEL